MKLGKNVPFYYFSRGTLDLFRLGILLLLLLPTSHSLLGAFAATAFQFANQSLGGFSHLFRDYIPGTHFVACRDIGKDFATGAQRLAAHCFSPAPQKWAVPAKEIAEK